MTLRVNDEKRVECHGRGRGKEMAVGESMTCLAGAIGLRVTRSTLSPRDKINASTQPAFQWEASVITVRRVLHSSPCGLRYNDRPATQLAGATVVDSNNESVKELSVACLTGNYTVFLTYESQICSTSTTSSEIHLPSAWKLHFRTICNHSARPHT